MKSKTFKSNFVTLYADSSFRQKVGTYAFWSRHSEGRIMKSGDAPAECVQIHLTEMYEENVKEY